MTRPNFLLIGAAKCGTSSLFDYVCQHPDVFGPANKEPSYYSHVDRVPNYSGPGDNFFNEVVVHTLEDYQALFASAGAHAAIGEASVLYLYDQQAAERIRADIPDAKLIAILRDPVERAYSAWLHKTRDGFETLPFEEALHKEEERAAAGWQHIWHYRRMGLYGEQLARYVSLFPRDNLLIIKYRDFRRETRATLARIFRFLKVEPFEQVSIERRLNVGFLPRFRAVHSLVRRRSVTKEVLKRVLPTERRRKLKELATKLNALPAVPPISSATQEMLRQSYAADIRRLEDVTGISFDEWR